MKMRRDSGGGKLHRVSATKCVPANIRVRTNIRVLDKQQLPGILIGGTCPGVSTQLADSASYEMHANTPRSPFPTCEHDFTTTRD